MRNLLCLLLFFPTLVFAAQSPVIWGPINSALFPASIHIKSTGTAPTATVNANAGTGGTCTLSNASDVAGTVNLTSTATSPTTGEQCKVNFTKSYGVAPICVLYPATGLTASLAVSSQVNATATTAKLSVGFGATDAAGHAYVWNYLCVETQ